LTIYLRTFIHRSFAHYSHIFARGHVNMR